MPTEPTQDCLLIGAGSTIGQAVLRRWLQNNSTRRVFAVSRDVPAAPDLAGDGRVTFLPCDHSPQSIDTCIDNLTAHEPLLTRLVICLGILHDEDSGLWPEKRLEDIREDALLQVYRVNAVLPQVWIARLQPLLPGRERSVMAVFSARVGSIADNRLGGWHAYRASKAALNMLLRNSAIELARRKPNFKLIAFHPGTTDTPLSTPFQQRVAEGKLFTPGFVADRLVELMDSAEPDGTLSYLDYAGKAIPW